MWIQHKSVLLGAAKKSWHFISLIKTWKSIPFKELEQKPKTNAHTSPNGRTDGFIAFNFYSNVGKECETNARRPPTQAQPSDAV